MPTNGRPGWHQFSRKAYFNLVSDFIEDLAVHLETKGVLDRAVIVIDENDPSTYPLIRDYVLQGLKTQPHAKQIHVAHTTYKTSTWTRRGKNGNLILDDVIDMPMPEPVGRVIPSYRLSLMRDGIQTLTLLKVLETGRDDNGNVLKVDLELLAQSRAAFDRLFAPNPVQWYLSLPQYKSARRLLYESVLSPEDPARQ